MAKALAVRLQRFAAYGKLPDEIEKQGPFTRPEAPASPPSVLFSNPPRPRVNLSSALCWYDDDEYDDEEYDDYEDYELEMLDEVLAYSSDDDPDFISRDVYLKPQDSVKLLNVKIKPHPEAVAAGLRAAEGRDFMQVAEEAEKDPYDDSELGSMPDDLACPETKLYIVHAFKGEACHFIVGIFDDRDVAECEMDNYLYDLEQADHDMSLFTTDIEERTLNEVCAVVPT